MTPARLRIAPLLAAALLAGCASVDIDQAITDTNGAAGSFTLDQLELDRSQEQQQRRARLTTELLARPLSTDDAVRVALANSPAVQALLADAWTGMADAAQAGRIANPAFSFERVRSGAELEIGRLLSFGLLDLLTLPRRQQIASNQLAQARVQLAAAVVDQVSQVRQVWVRAVAAQQSLQYARQVNESAQASAELARRMQQAGNFSRLQRARQQSFYADATAQLASASHAATSTREALVRLLGLGDEQAGKLQLPERLPDLPPQPRAANAITADAMQQRLDLQLARLQLQGAGQAQGLDLLHRLADVELGARRDTRFDNAAGTRSTARGWELDIRLPLFDWGQAQRAGLNARSLAAANRYDAVSRAASSQLRENYSAYRTAHDLARHYRDEVVPLRKAISDENLLRYNGMLIGVFELLADHREQVAAVIAAIDAQQQFWLADAALSSALVGRPMSLTPSAAATVRSGGEAAH